MKSWLVACLLAGPPAEGPQPPPPDPPDPEGPRHTPGDGGGKTVGSTSPLQFEPEFVPDSGRKTDGLGLERRADGSMLYVDPDFRFTAVFREDGTVNFADPWRRPHPMRPDTGKIGGIPPGVFQTNSLTRGLEVPGPTEWLMRLHGHIFYYNKKSALLDKTRGMRTALAINHAKQNIETKLSELQADLIEIWDREGMSDTAKREVLFELWDDCDERFEVAPAGVPEEAVSEIDGFRLKAATKARRRIERFVRANLPRSSDRGYRSDELRSLNARRISKERFSPYNKK